MRFVASAILESDTALVLYDSNRDVRFEGNVFSGNLSPLLLVGRHTDTVFDGNFWSDHDEPDLDGDGVRDRPYRLSNVFDHLRGNLTAADLFAQGFGASVLGAAERMFPVLELSPVLDAHPLARGRPSWPRCRRRRQVPIAHPGSALSSPCPVSAAG
jgi:nitrous oxidase accessory protein